MIKIYLIMLFIALSVTAFAQTHKEVIKRTIDLPEGSDQAVVLIDNINGMVEVEPSNSRSISLEAKLEITGKTDAIVEKGKQEVEIVSKVKGDTVLIYFLCPAMTNHRQGGKHFYNYDSRKIEYDFKVDFKLKIPNNLLADISTVNQGDIIVKSHKGSLKASNVNGNIYLEDVAAVLKATTVNGEIKINCEEQIKRDATFKTINGTIHLEYPKSLSTFLKLKSFNGEFYTDYKVEKYLPTEVNTINKKGKATTYELDSYTTVQINDGGPTIRVETLNGNIYVKSKEL